MQLRISKDRLAKLLEHLKEKNRDSKAVLAFLLENGFQQSDYIQSRYRDVLKFFYNEDTKLYEYNEQAVRALTNQINKKWGIPWKQ